MDGLALLHSAHLDLVLDESERFALAQLDWHLFHVELVSLAFIKHGGAQTETYLKADGCPLQNLPAFFVHNN